MKANKIELERWFSRKYNATYRLVVERDGSLILEHGSDVGGWNHTIWHHRHNWKVLAEGEHPVDEMPVVVPHA